MFVVDTNILLYAAERQFPEHRRSREFVLRCRDQSSSWYLTWGIVYEFLRVATHPRVFRKPWSVAGAWKFVEAILASRGLTVLVETDRHAAVAAEVIKDVPLLGGNLLHDAHTAVLMREHGVKQIYTRDTDFNRFGFIEVVDPLA
ncbi:MAG: TA system VapC family ribonuclease toxin [Planctomycetota bacterium]